MKKSLILLVILFLLSLLTSGLAKAASYSGQPIPHSVGRSSNLPPMQISPYKDNNEKLYAVVGKTQLIKFDEPVKRISLTDPSLADLVLLSPKELLLNGKKSGRTSLLFWGSSEKPVFFNMVVQQDTDAKCKIHFHGRRVDYVGKNIFDSGQEKYYRSGKGLWRKYA